MTASYTEIIWTCVALIGLIVQIWATIDAVADLHYLQALGLNGAREIVAFGSARDEMLRTVIQCMFFMIGVIAMLTAPSNPDRSVTTLGAIIAGSLCLAAVLLVVTALLDRRDRQRVIELLARKDDNG